MTRRNTAVLDSAVQVTAAQLVRDNMCSPNCLVAAQHEAVSCGCRCDGAYHARLATVTITLAAGHTRPAAAAALAGQLALDLDAV